MGNAYGVVWKPLYKKLGFTVQTRLMRSALYENRAIRNAELIQIISFVRRMTHQIEVLSAQKCSCLSRCVRARLRRWNFLISWKTLVVYHSELIVLHCSSGTTATCPKNRWSFAWKCFVRDQLLLDLAYLKTNIQKTAVYFRTHTRKSTIHHLSRCHRRVSKQRDSIFGALISTDRHEPFFERLTNCVESNANKFFWPSNVHAILILMPKVVTISR